MMAKYNLLVVWLLSTYHGGGNFTNLICSLNPDQCHLYIAICAYHHPPRNQSPFQILAPFQVLHASLYLSQHHWCKGCVVGIQHELQLHDGAWTILKGAKICPISALVFKKPTQLTDGSMANNNWMHPFPPTKFGPSMETFLDLYKDMLHPKQCGTSMVT